MPRRQAASTGILLSSTTSHHLCLAEAQRPRGQWVGMSALEKVGSRWETTGSFEPPRNTAHRVPGAGRARSLCMSKGTTGTQGRSAHLGRGCPAPSPSSPHPNRQSPWMWGEHGVHQGGQRILSQPREQAGNTQACSWGPLHQSIRTRKLLCPYRGRVWVLAKACSELMATLRMTPSSMCLWGSVNAPSNVPEPLACARRKFYLFPP